MLNAVVLAEQEPKVRPTARYLMQHKFVTQAMHGPPAGLLNLIQQSQELILAAAIADQEGTLQGPRSRYVFSCACM